MKTVAATLTALAMVPFLVGSANAADDFPNKTITITNIYAVGGGTDLIARAIGRKLSEKWHVPVIIDSKPGAGGTIAAAYVARQPADGYNLLVTDVSFSIVPSVYKKLTYDPMKDLAPVILINSVTQALTISPELPVNTVPDLVAYAKKNPGKLVYASAGVGSLTQLGMEVFKKTAGIDILHVPYRGAVTAFTDVMGGRAQMYMGALATPLPQIMDGKLKAIAVMQKTRSDLLPNVQSIVEAGYPDLDFNAYYGLLAPQGTPRPVLDKLVAAIRETFKAPEIQKIMHDLACESVGAGPDEFAAFLKKDVARWEKAAEIAGITPNN
jgi:tripartite-type tricarboxylate transporter receptor subunit TctC